MTLLVKRKTPKSYKVQIKPKHRIVAEKLAENGGNRYKAMLSAGYSKEVAENPKKVLETKSFRMIAEEIGLTDSFILEALKNDIRDKPRNRIGELTLASKIKGMTKENDNQNVTNVLILPNELIRKPLD